MMQPPKSIRFDVSEIIHRVNQLLIEDNSYNGMRDQIIMVLVTDITDRIIQSDLSHIPCSWEVMDILNRIHVQPQSYLKMAETLLDFYQETISILSKLIMYYREDYVTDVCGKFVTNTVYQIEIFTTKPSRDYISILTKEIDEALSRNEFVPYKYLKLIGRLK